MKTRGYAVTTAKAPLGNFEFERRALRPRDVALDIYYSGICHSDIHQAREEWGPAIFPMVPGHEIVGKVIEIGSQVSKFKVGELIGVGVFIDSCKNCASCGAGLEQYCVEGMTGTYNTLERDGKTIAFGGYSNKFVIDEDYAVHVPSNLELSGVAPLMCAGITLYSPLKNWKAGPGKKVGVMGLGGLGHMGVKFAHALGAETTVFSHSPEKESDAKAMGAYAVNAGTLLGQRRSLAGSMIGGIAELQQMLNFCGEHNIVSDVEVIKSEYINTAYDRTVASDVKYRFVIDAKTF